ncbi:MAG: response regulator [Marinospirillum sp.]|uniref:ATP-binding response regulator n=1 Tax=Marinospirillum sp. TaxID=2183934 RepID=UPI0019FB0B6C|nr:response regulator [Marinospirillum sp.]MBE0505165.1 response regulator [Marinospirillum sp.]
MLSDKKYNLLLIEDNRVQAVLTQGLLKKAGYFVYWAPTAEEGLQYLQQEPVDLILMDVELPGMNGYQAVRQVRLMDGDYWRPILMVTADDSARGWQETHACGADDYLHKPIQQHHLLHKISIMLRLYTSYYANLQAQKLKALGQFAAGIAHDFNNLLLIIKGNAEMIYDDPGDADFNQSSATDIIISVNRSTKLIEQLEIYASDRQPKIEPLVLSHFLKDYSSWTAKHLPQHLKLKLEIEPEQEDCIILANSVQITRVLDNLVKNAVLAMANKDKACLSIRLKNVQEAQETQKTTEDASIKRVIVQVSDEGEGIPEENLNVIFDPFFTTRDVWQGFGLGLSVVAGIVRQHHGQIKVHSQLGVGTSFDLIFPVLLKSNLERESS